MLTRDENCKHRLFPTASYSIESFFVIIAKRFRNQTFSCDAAKYTWSQGYGAILCDNLAILYDIVQCVQTLEQGDISKWNLSYCILSHAYRTASRMESRFKYFSEWDAPNDHKIPFDIISRTIESGTQTNCNSELWWPP